MGQTTLLMPGMWAARILAIAALLAAVAPTTAFLPGPTASRLTASSRAARKAFMRDEDPTGSPLIQAINSLQEALQNSPVAKFKAGLAKLQAGNYDVEATRAELNRLIAEEPVLMLSFTT